VLLPALATYRLPVLSNAMATGSDIPAVIVRTSLELFGAKTATEFELAPDTKTLPVLEKAMADAFSTGSFRNSFELSGA
jgi:hypothetical protein